jgi:SAM-dependent methyltransferase
MSELKAIDIGCGRKKKPGYIGVDNVAVEGVDVVVDLEREPLPFADDSVKAVFSSHCIEHLTNTEAFFKEITRVCAHGATVELWHPHSANNDAFLLGHTSFLNDNVYTHIGSLGHAFWAKVFGGRWIVKELVFAIYGHVLQQLDAEGISVDFAVQHLHNIVAELGVIAEIDKQNPLPDAAPPPRRVYAVSREPGDRRPLEPGPARVLPLPPPPPPEPTPDPAPEVVEGRFPRVTRLAHSLIDRLARL